jgi:hypothetical protein
MAGEGDRGKASLALVSVLATAAVGIAGSATTLLVSRDQRATERANRIYERRAAAYVEAIDTLERHMKTLANLDWSRARRPADEGPDASWRFAFEDVPVEDETDMARVRSRLVAFGSTEAIAAFDRVSALDKKAFALVLADIQPTGQPDFDVWESNVSQAIDDLRDGITEFETRLNRELTS